MHATNNFYNRSNIVKILLNIEVNKKDNSPLAVLKGRKKKITIGFNHNFRSSGHLWCYKEFYWCLVQLRPTHNN